MSIEEIPIGKTNKRRYLQKFRKTWKTDPEFSLWLEEKDGLPFCTACNRHFREGTCRFELTRHLKTTQHEENMSKVQEECCRICFSEGNINYMMNIYECDGDYRIFEKINIIGGIDIPMDSIPKRICQQCYQAVKNAFSFRELCRLSAKRFANGTEVYQEEPSLEHHPLEPADSVELPAEEEPTKESHICEVCGLQFDKKFRLVNHLKWHNNIRPFKCDSCEKSFAQTCDLKSHLRVHTGAKPYNCSSCDKCFSSLSAKLCHERLHRNERPFVCEVCSKSFTYGNTLKKHMKTHTGEKNYSCDVCDKFFAEAHHLKSHLKSYVHFDNVNRLEGDSPLQTDPL